MPKLNKVAPVSTHESFELVWMKATQLAETSERFCIDSITKGKNADDYGNYYWFVRCITDNQAEGTRTMIKFQQGTDSRDSYMQTLMDALKAAAADEDKNIHFVYVKQLPGSKNKQGATVLATNETETCSCGYYNKNNVNEVEITDDLGELDDHPF